MVLWLGALTSVCCCLHTSMWKKNDATHFHIKYPESCPLESTHDTLHVKKKKFVDVIKVKDLQDCSIYSSKLNQTTLVLKSRELFG